VLASQPDIFAALHANYQPVTAADPATSGEELVVYAATRAQRLPCPRMARRETAKIATSNAPVSFSGLASGFVALYQVNVQVPTGLTLKRRVICIQTKEQRN
jgi:uncharacterized protein (TIGR03437 family)